MMKQKEQTGAQRRRYIRLDSVFPVQFRLMDLGGKCFLSNWIQGFTNNVSRGGICLSVNNLPVDLAHTINNKEAKLSLEITIPLGGAPVTAEAKVAWVTKTGLDQYLIGLSYEHIDPQADKRIMRYAWTKRLILPVTFSLILIFGLGFAVNSIINMQLAKGNKALVNQLVKVVQESSIAKQKVKEIVKEREDLQLKIHGLQQRISTAEEERTRLSKKINIEETLPAQVTQKIEELNSLVKKLAEDKTSLQEQLGSLQKKESVVTEELLRLDKNKSVLEKANIDKMYMWLKAHQNPRTGLVMSFEGDSEIANWAFTYDQALLIDAYTYFSDFERARKILSFYDTIAKRQEGWFFNAYYVHDGNPTEYVTHSGPNIWLGLACLQYAHKSNDNQFVGLAEEIAKNIMRLQNQDKDSGIRGGPNCGWYSTEHNLDAYAFFNMLYKITGREEYYNAAQKTLNWLVKYAYADKDIPVKRGKGDSTIATDTYAWSIAAIGPEKLNELNMNPDRITEFAEQNCRVEVSYMRPEGTTVRVKGFDFAPQRNVARGGVVSSEWTAQMTLTFKIMADYYYKKGLNAKAHAYAMKADEYMAQLGNMIISSPSPTGQGEGCLPYATQDLVDTGHGWKTPKGKSTGSVAGTALALFAYYNFNPLEIKE